MSFSFAPCSSRTKDDHLRSEEPNLAARLFEVGFLLRSWRARLRMGELSRAPLRLLRFELNQNFAECEWIARTPDPSDARGRPETARRHASGLALRDAVKVRSLIFTLMPDVDQATLRVYRESPASARELIIAGQVQRYGGVYRPALSIAMRARLLGLCFVLENGILCGSVVAEGSLSPTA
jgi:hypothetical protein